jgi:hypothetical protein
LKRQNVPSPAANSPEQTMKPTHLVYSRGNLVKKLLIGIGLIGAGIAMAALNKETSYKFGGAVLGFFGLVQLAGIRSGGVGGSGPCPRCGTEIKAGSNTQQNRLCPGCHHYLKITDREITEMPASTVTAEPKFAVPTPWADLKNVAFQLPANTFPGKAEARTLEANWPHACCVCGQQPNRTITSNFTIYHSKNLVKVKYTPIVISIIDVPYCAQHEKGITINNIEFKSNKEIQNNPYDLAVLFRSYGYRNSFLAQNPWPWV